MKKATLRDLRYNFKKVDAHLRAGESVEITRRKRLIGVFVPISKKKRLKRPDFWGRLRKLFGRKKLKVTGAELVAWDRGRE